MQIYRKTVRGHYELYFLLAVLELAGWCYAVEGDRADNTRDVVFFAQEA